MVRARGKVEASSATSTRRRSSVIDEERHARIDSSASWLAEWRGFRRPTGGGASGATWPL